MRQAEAINSVGIYIVGKIDPNAKIEKPVSQQQIDLFNRWMENFRFEEQHSTFMLAYLSRR